MEYLSGGALSDIIENLHESGKKLKDIDASKMVKEILEAVEYLHELNTVHRDLKPGNLIINLQRKHYAW
jgi:serine/threonine protein kinase